MSISKQGFAGAAIGAAVTAVVMVTAYEGRVLLANEKGKTQIAAGERGTATDGSPPGRAVDAKTAKRPAIAIVETPPPPEGASREDLLKRDAEQRKVIAKLAAQVAELAQGGGDDGKHPGLRPHAFKTHPSQDELLEMAKSCTVQFDNPPLEGEVQLPSKIAERAGLSPEETAAVQKVMDQTNIQVLAQLRALYIEVTGNKGAAEELSAQALINEVHAKGGRAEASAAQAEIANERAGLVPVPADLTSRPPSERMLRILSSQGDDLERAVGQVIGADRASALRGEGWGSRMQMSGCRDGSEEDTR